MGLDCNYFNIIKHNYRKWNISILKKKGTKSWFKHNSGTTNIILQLHFLSISGPPFSYRTAKLHSSLISSPFLLSFPIFQSEMWVERIIFDPIFWNFFFLDEFDSYVVVLAEFVDHGCNHEKSENKNFNLQADSEGAAFLWERGGKRDCQDRWHEGQRRWSVRPETTGVSLLLSTYWGEW